MSLWDAKRCGICVTPVVSMTGNANSRWLYICLNITVILHECWGINCNQKLNLLLKGLIMLTTKITSKFCIAAPFLSGMGVPIVMLRLSWLFYLDAENPYDRGYPAKRTLPAILTHVRLGPFGRIPLRWCFILKEPLAVFPYSQNFIWHNCCNVNEVSSSMLGLVLVDSI